VALLQGELDTADEHFEQALRIRRITCEPDDPTLATVYFNQGEAAAARQDWQAAERLHRRALEIQQKRLASSHPDIGRSLVALSRILDRAGERDEAVRLAKNALRLRTANLDPQHMLVTEVKQLLDQLSGDQPATK
jgi:tetratricopeptide (TPR) repeat protein